MVLESVEADPMPMAISWQVRVAQVFEYLTTAIKISVRDPKGIQGDLNDLDRETRDRLSQSAFISSLSVAQAIKFEKEGDLRKALNQWQLIFGDKFPDYGA